MKSEIRSFTGEYNFLSNFFPCNIMIDAVEFQNAEAAFQAQKTTGISELMRFCRLDALSAKRLGRRVALRPDWEHIKDDVMLDVVRAKFYQNPELGRKLIQTGNAVLIEGNTWGDRYWGACNGQGRNKLGCILMHVRAILLYESVTAEQRKETDG